MESSSGSKGLAAKANGAAAGRSSRPPARELEKAVRAAKPASDGGPASAIDSAIASAVASAMDAIPGGDTAGLGGNGKWKKGWRGRGANREGTPLNILVIEGPISQIGAMGPAIIHRYSSETERTMALIPEAVRHKIEVVLEKRGQKFDPALVKPCPFTDMEIEELATERDLMDASKPAEMLIYLPKDLTPSELCEMWGLKSNINFDVDRNVALAMKKEDQWFLTQARSAPEMIDCTATEIRTEYGFHANGDQVVHGMDIRRYLEFLGYHKEVFGEWPDRQYWVWLWGAAYDRSGIMISGLDARDELNSHGWMWNFKAKFVGGRYAILAPREEVNAATEYIRRVRYDSRKNKLMKRNREHIDRILAERAAREKAGEEHLTPEGGVDADESGCSGGSVEEPEGQ